MSTPESALKPEATGQAKTGDVDIEPLDQKGVESLLAAERRTLEMIACGASLSDILEDLCSAIDAQSPEIISTVLLMDPDGQRMWPAAGSRVPGGYTEAIAPVTIGPRIGSCGAAAFLKEPVIASDIANDLLWAVYRDLALSHGLRAAWSHPLLSRSHEVLGTFCIYNVQPRTPSDADLRLIEGAANIAVIAIEGERSQRR